MLSELICFGLVLVISIQSSSLWTSLITIPFSMVLILITSPDKASNLIVMIFIMIFIGGLLILLVSVATAVHQEQAMAISVSILCLSGLVVFFFMKKNTTYDWSQTSMIMFHWVSKMKLNFLLFNTLLLLTCLIVMSSLLMEFKGIIRKL